MNGSTVLVLLGYGGGFMERETVVQYKQSRSAEAEDEYDEVCAPM